MKMLHKFRIALAVTLLALAAVPAVDSASAQSGRIPDTSSLLATYRVTTDDAGDVAGYERVRRYNRSSAVRVVRQNDLAAVVSDAPGSLRPRNRARPVGTPLRAMGGGSYQHRVDFGERTSSRSWNRRMSGGDLSRGGMNTRSMGGRRSSARFGMVAADDEAVKAELASEARRRLP
jgi:Gas vesicle synthesis protein GvpO